MTPQQKQNFQQGWLDLLKRHGATAGIAAFLVWQTTGRNIVQLDRIEARLEAASSAAAAVASAASDAAKDQASVAAALVKQAEADRGQVRVLIALMRQVCVNTAHNDDQRQECVK